MTTQRSMDICGGAFAGLALAQEINRAVEVLSSSGAAGIALMHLPTGYPAPVEKTDLRIIPRLKAGTGLPIGLSCHSIGLDAVLASACSSPSNSSAVRRGLNGPGGITASSEVVRITAPTFCTGHHIMFVWKPSMAPPWSTTVTPSLLSTINDIA